MPFKFITPIFSQKETKSKSYENISSFYIYEKFSDIIKICFISELEYKKINDVSSPDFYIHVKIFNYTQNNLLAEKTITNHEKQITEINDIINQPNSNDILEIHVKVGEKTKNAKLNYFQVFF